MKLIKSLLSYFAYSAEKPQARIKKGSRRELAIRRLVATGEITLAEIGGNSPSKDMTDLRRAGLVMALGSYDGERWETNPKTGCKFKVYRWTGKVPANWIKSDAYTGLERRSRNRSK